MTERPEVLLSASDYMEDIKIRWQIHQFEVKKLQEDLSLVFNAITDKAFYAVTDRWYYERGDPLFFMWTKGGTHKASQ